MISILLRNRDVRSLTSQSWPERISDIADRQHHYLNVDKDYGSGGETELEAMLVTKSVGYVCLDIGTIMKSIGAMIEQY